MIELYINKQRVDITDDINIAFTYSTGDLENPQAIKNSFSKNVKIPGTPNNNKIFSNIFRNDFEIQNVNSDTNVFNPRKKIEFFINENGAFIESGYMTLTSVEYNYPNIEYYNVTLYGGLGNFFYGLDTDDNGNKKTLYDLFYHWKSSLAPSITGTDFDETTEKTNTIIDMTPKNISFWWAKLDNTKYQTDLTADTFTPVVSPVGNDIVAIPCYNGLPENFDAEHICVYDYNRRYAGSENTPQMPYSIKQQWNATFPQTFTDDGTTYSMLDAEYNDSGYQIAGIAKAARPLDQWEARNLPVNNFNVGLRLRRFITAICDPHNNGGYHVKFDDEFLYSNEFLDSFILLDKPFINKDLAPAKYNLTWTGETNINWVVNRRDDGSGWDDRFTHSVSDNPTDEQFLDLGDQIDVSTLENKKAIINLDLELGCEIGNRLMEDDVRFRSGVGLYTQQLIPGPHGQYHVVTKLEAWDIYGTIIFIKAYGPNNTVSDTYCFVVTYNDDFVTNMGYDAKADLLTLIDNYHYPIIGEVQYITANVNFSSSTDSHSASDGYTDGTKLVKNIGTIKLNLNIDPEYNNSIPQSIYRFGIETAHFWQHQTNTSITSKILNTSLSDHSGINWGFACYENNGYSIPQCLFTTTTFDGIRITARRQEAYIKIRLNDSLYSGISYADNQMINTKLTKKDILGGTDTPYKYLTDLTKLLNMKYLYDSSTNTIEIVKPNNYYITTTNGSGDKLPVIVKPVVDKSFTEKREPVFWNKRLYYYGLTSDDNYYTNYLYNKESSIPWDTSVFDTKLYWNNDINNVLKDNIYVQTMPWQLSSIYFKQTNNMLPPVYAQPVVGWKLASYNSNEMKQVEKNFYTDVNQTSLKYYDPMPKEMLQDKENKYVVTKNSLILLNGYIANYNWVKNSDSKWSLEGLTSISLPTPEMMVFNEQKQCYVYNNNWTALPNGYCIPSDEYTVTPLYIPVFSKFSFNYFVGSQHLNVGYWENYHSGYECVNFTNNEFPYDMLVWQNAKFAKKPYAGSIISNIRNTEDDSYYNVLYTDTQLPADYTLYNKLFKPYVDDMFSNSARRITIRMRIDERPQTLMRKFIDYDGCLWTIEKIENYNINSFYKDGHFCKTTLVKVNDPFKLIGANEQ